MRREENDSRLVSRDCCCEEGIEDCDSKLRRRERGERETGREVVGWGK